MDAIQRYWFGLLLGALSLLVTAFLTVCVLRLNKRLTRAKARLKQRQELLLNSVAEGIYGVDLNGKVDDDILWRKDGTSFPADYSATPIRDEQDRTTEWVRP